MENVTGGQTATMSTPGTTSVPSQVNTQTQSQPVDKSVANSVPNNLQTTNLQTEGVSDQQPITQPDGKSTTETTDPTPVEMFKLKTNGKEEDVSRDEVVRRAQMYTASEARFQEAAQMRKEAEHFLLTLVESPEKVLLNPKLAERGFNFRKFAEEWLYKELQREQMPPEERQALAEKEELERFRRDDAERKRKEQEQTKETLRQQYAEKVEGALIKALESGSVPVNNETIARLAKYLRFYSEKGIKNPPMEIILDNVRKDYQQMVQSLFAVSDPQFITSVLGPEITEKLRKHDIQQVRQTIPQVPAKPIETPKAGTQSKPQKRYISMDEARAEIDRKINS